MQFLPEASLELAPNFASLPKAMGRLCLRESRLSLFLYASEKAGIYTASISILEGCKISPGMVQ